MSFYEVLTLLHIIAAIIWLGAGFMLGVLVFSAARAGDRQREAGYHQDVGRLTPLFVASSLSTFLLGLALVIDSDAWSFGELWIDIAMAGWLFSFLIGFFFFRPEAQRITAIVAERGPGDPDADRRVHRLNVLDRVQLVVLFLVVVDMVAKPTGDDAGLLIGGAVVLAAAAALAATAISRGPTEPAAPSPG